MHHISQNLKYYREANRFTQQEIADKLKTTVGRIKTYESGTATPQVEMLISIAEMMGVTIDHLIKTPISQKKGFEKIPDESMLAWMKKIEKSISKLSK